MKRILDTVHGYIMVPDEFMVNIVDTTYFQRLRRVEQTSIRSVYPSARHDRFIHSLGVYHIGSLIVEHFQREEKANHYWGMTQTTMMVIYNSYLVACLLHDVAHAPFSHTFEKYYGQKSVLANKLKMAVQNKNFSKDLYSAILADEPNFHEYMSAFVAYTRYNDSIRMLGLDPEFVARMITGVYYCQDKDRHQIHNCFISLLHGRVIDADRLDYACRDVWASGYSTSSIDLRRLISALHIKRNQDHEFVVCFESNSLNEIEGVLNVKDFQVKYVINHHVVKYEQDMLVKAAEWMALQYYPAREDDLNPGFTALNRLLCCEAIVDEITVPNTQLRISNLSDDDLVFLMKQHKDNPYYAEWSSRQYSHFALWKSPDEFYYNFKEIKRNKNLTHNQFQETVYNALEAKGVTNDEIMISKTEFKPRVKMDSLYLVVADKVVRYTDIYPDSKNENENIGFYYVYLKKHAGESKEDRDKRKDEIFEELRQSLPSLYIDAEEENG